MTTTASCPSGHAVRPGAIFCGECGAAIGSEDQGGARYLPADDAQAAGGSWPPVPSSPPATPSGAAQPFASAQGGAAATPRRRRTRMAVVAGVIAAAVAAVGVVATPRVLALLEDPKGLWLVTRTSSSGDESLYLAEENDGQLVRGPRLATGELVWPLNTASLGPLELPYVEWTDRRVFTTQDSDSLDMVAMPEDGTPGQELLSIPAANGGLVYAIPDNEAFLVSGQDEGSEICYLVRPGASPLELAGQVCWITPDSVVAVDNSGTDTTWFVRYGFDGRELSRARVGAPDAEFTLDLQWALSTLGGSDGIRFVVQDVASGRVVHESEPGATVRMLARAAEGHGLVYALDTGDEQLRIVHVRPDGTARTLTETQVSSAALSDDGGTAWYVTGSLDNAKREVFRVTDDGEPAAVGSGDNLQVFFAGGPHSRLIASGRSGQSGVDLYVAMPDSALTLVGDAPDVRFGGFTMNPASGTIYVELDDDVEENEAEGESREHTGMLLRVAADGKTASTLAEGHDSASSVMFDEGDDTVVMVGSTGEEEELLVSKAGQLREVDRAPSISSVFLSTGGDVYFSTSEGEGGNEVARRIPADGSEPPVTVLEDVRWAAIPDSIAPPSESWITFDEVRARVDYGARECASSGTTVVDVFGSGAVPVPLGVSDVCFKVDAASQVSLTAQPESATDLMMTLTGYSKDGPYVVGTDDDSGGDRVPLINVALEPGTYRITTRPYGSYPASAYQISGCRAEPGASDPCAIPVQG